MGECVLVDAAGQGAGSRSVGLIPTNPQAWLYRGAKLIAHVTGVGATLSATIPATAATYTLKIAATRDQGNVPVGGIARSVSATYTFAAEAGDTSLASTYFMPRMIPQGVSETNTAAPGSKTTVPITFDTAAGPVTAEHVAVWASSNGGRTWTPLRVTDSGGAWTVTVDNPKAKGYVSLRVQGEEAMVGSTASVTAINAYAVS